MKLKDPNLYRDIDLVARYILARAVRDVEWGDYPDIGENDWALVIERLDELAPWPNFWGEAYEHLETRARKWIAPDDVEHNHQWTVFFGGVSKCFVCRQVRP